MRMWKDLRFPICSVQMKNKLEQIKNLGFLKDRNLHTLLLPITIMKSSTDYLSHLVISRLEIDSKNPLGCN